MNAVTYEFRNAAALSTAKPAAPAGKRVWTRIWDAMIEARMRQAEREIRMHLHLIPRDVLADSGLAASLKDSGKLPFVK
jgi:hypothetical protein